jgi:hypothetical protein
MQFPTYNRVYVNDQQGVSIAIQPDSYPALFIVTVIPVKFVEQMSVQKDGARIFKRYAMLLQVGLRFCRIPLIYYA